MQRGEILHSSRPHPGLQSAQFLLNSTWYLASYKKQQRLSVVPEYLRPGVEAEKKLYSTQSESVWTVLYSAWFHAYIAI